MARLRLILVVLALTIFASEAGAVGVTLKGSPASIQRQHSVAKDQGFTFVETPDQVPELVAAEELIPVVGNAHYEVLDGVSHKFARPEMRLFIERLAEQYHEGTGEKLVVTSLTRASSEQPRNSHPLSVHPTGMAVDLRISSSQKSRAWIESVLLKLEREGVLDITRERYPPHYHVALFPIAYMDYIESMIGTEALAEALEFKAEEPAALAADQNEETAGSSAGYRAAAATAVGAGTDEGSPAMWVMLAVLPLVLIPVVLLWRRRELAAAAVSATAGMNTAAGNEAVNAA